MKLLILSDLHAEFEPVEVPKGLEYDVAILAGDIVAPGRVAAGWLRNPARFGDKPIVQVAGNHEYFESVMDQALAEMHRQPKAHDMMPAEFVDVPVRWVHGHTHDSFDYDVRGCRVVCNPRGYMTGTPCITFVLSAWMPDVAS